MDTPLNSAVIRSIGTAVPPHRISQEIHYKILESANGLDRSGRLMLKNIYRNSGITSRHSVLEEFGKNDHPENLIFHPAGDTEHVSVRSA